MKREVGRIPFVGWVAVLSGHYQVSRDGSRADIKEVKKIVGNMMVSSILLPIKKQIELS